MARTSTGILLQDLTIRSMDICVWTIVCDNFLCVTYYTSRCADWLAIDYNIFILCFATLKSSSYNYFEHNICTWALLSGYVTDDIHRK